MSESKLETVSLLVDNYQSTNEDFDDLIADKSLSETWSNYHLIGDAMRGELAPQLDLDLSSSIANALDQEPTILAPQKMSRAGKIKAKVIPLMKPFGQMAIAASAAGLMIFGVQQNIAGNTEIDAPSPVVQTMPFGGTASPVSLNYAQPNVNAQKQAIAQQQRRFQALLTDHHQQMKLKAKAVNDVAVEQDKTKEENLPK